MAVEVWCTWLHGLLRFDHAVFVSASCLRRAVRHLAGYLMEKINVDLWNLPGGPVASALPASVSLHVIELLKRSGRQAASVAVIQWLLTNDDQVVRNFLTTLKSVQQEVSEQLLSTGTSADGTS